MGKLIPNAFNLAVVIFVALGSTACSYGMAIISSTIGQPTFYSFFELAASPAEEGYGHTSALIGAMNGLSSVGSVMGAGFTSWAADKWGRRINIQAGCLALILGAGLCAGAVNMSMFLVARFVAGVGIGMLVTGIPMYQAEVSTPESRGFMVSMHGVMFAVGYTSSAWIGFSTYFMKGNSSFSWRFPLAFQGAPAILLLLGTFNHSSSFPLASDTDILKAHRGSQNPPGGSCNKIVPKQPSPSSSASTKQEMTRPT
jgi:MFS family permease